jgi:hypothetical protein
MNGTVILVAAIGGVGGAIVGTFLGPAVLGYDPDRHSDARGAVGAAVGAVLGGIAGASVLAGFAAPPKPVALPPAGG